MPFETIKLVNKYKLLSLFSCKVVSGSFATPWTVAHEAHLSMRFSKQKHWSGLPFLSPGGLPHVGIKPMSLALQANSLPLSHQGNPD